jgi:serine/threonine protein kinase
MDRLQTDAALAHEDGAALAGKVAGRYHVLRPLGADWAGPSYAAYDPLRRREVALKLWQRPAGATRSLDALQGEAQAIARLAHRNVVAVLDVGRLGDRLLVVSELSSCITLREWFAKPRTLAQVVAVMRQAGRALAAAHRAGIVHRDFRPECVLVRADGHVRVRDFGLASAVAEGAHGGRPVGCSDYQAPEVRGRRAACARSDQYSFAAVLFEAVHGQRPSPEGAMPLTRLPIGLTRLLAQGLQMVPAARFASMERLLERLDRVTRRRSRAVRGLALGVGALLLAGAAVPMVLPRRQPRSMGVAPTPAAASVATRSAIPAPPPVPPPSTPPAAVVAAPTAAAPSPPAPSPPADATALIARAPDPSDLETLERADQRLAAGHLHEARLLYESVLARHLRAGDDAPAATLAAWLGIGELLLADHHPARAEVAFARATALAAQMYPPGAVQRLPALVGRARALNALARRRAAAALLAPELGLHDAQAAAGGGGAPASEWIGRARTELARAREAALAR